MNTKILKGVSTAVSLVVGMGSAYPALAVIDEPLMYPGSNCKRESVSGGAPTITEDGRLKNDTASPITIQCPMYDNGTNFAGTVWVIDPSPSTKVSCTSKAQNPISGSGSQLKETTIPEFSSTPKALSFTGPTLGGTFTYRFYRCTLPSGSSLVNYRGKAS